MYYDVQVRLTQGWFAIYYDLSHAVAANIAERYHVCNGLAVRLVPHIVAA